MNPHVCSKWSILESRSSRSVPRFSSEALACLSASSSLLAATMKRALVLFVLFALSLSVCSALPARRTLAFALRQRNLGELERLFWERTNPTHKDYAKYVCTLLLFTHHLHFASKAIILDDSPKASVRFFRKFAKVPSSLQLPLTDLYSCFSPRWMSLEDLAKITGAEDDVLAHVQAQLTSQGAKNVRVSPSREYVLGEFKNDAANSILRVLGHPHASRKATADAFRTGAVLSSIAWTSSFASEVEYVMEVTDSSLSEIQAGVTVESGPRASRFVRSATGAFGWGMADPNSQKNSYGMPTDLVSKASNNSQMVWGPGTFGVAKSDLASFYSYWGLPSTTAQVDIPWFPGQEGGDNFGEGTLDATYTTSMAPGVKTYVVNSNTSMSAEEGPGFGYALENFLVLTLGQMKQVPLVFSMSLGSLSWDSCNVMCKLAVSQGVSYNDCLQYVQYTQRQVCMMDTAKQSERINTEFMKLGIRGVTLLAATGDGGSHYSFQPFPSDSIGNVLNSISCQYNFPTFPAASPYVLGVGGTQWSGAPSPSQPIAWTASGSGFSWRFPRPAYQDADVSNYLKQNSGVSGFPGRPYFNASNRAYPDVAAVADNVPMWMGGFPTATGGTSASTPTFAGMLSMINDQRLLAGKPSLGFVNPRLYQLNAANPGVLFYDVTNGNSACQSNGACCNTGFPATTGWDPVTGLGSPLWPGLLQFLSN